IFLNEFNIKEVRCVEDEYLEKAVDVFPLYFQFPSLEDKRKVVVVQGAVFYYPYLNEEETLPSPNPPFITEYESVQHKYGIECFWQGRLLPKYTNITYFFLISTKLKMISVLNL